MTTQYIIYIFLTIFVILSLIFYTKQRYNGKLTEGFLINKNKPRCPNLLIQKGNRIYLKNTELDEVPGVNPISFDNLEEYVDFIKWQKNVGIHCPVLYLQYSYNPQGKGEYKIRPSITEPQGGLPPHIPTNPYQQEKVKLLVDATRNDYPYNTNSLPGFDAHGQNIGTQTVLDTEELNDYQQNSLMRTDSAMSPYWNPQIAKQHIDEGVYKQNEVSIYIP